MAAATIAAIASIGLGAYQAYKGNQMTKSGQKNYNDYNRVDLTNAYKNTPVSSVATDMANEQNQIVSADMIEAFRNAGMRGVGMIPNVGIKTNKENQQTMAYLDNKIERRDYAIANDDVRIQQMKDAQDQANLAGIGNQIQTGRQDMYSGINTSLNGLFAYDMMNGDKKDETNEDGTPKSWVSKIFHI